MPTPTQSPKFGCTILGSGSLGNATVIHGPKGNLLLDAGFTAVEIRRRLEKVGVDPASIRAILITHAHTDHTNGCTVFSNHNSIPVYLIPETVLIMKRRKMPQVFFFLNGIFHHSTVPAGLSSFCLKVIGDKIGNEIPWRYAQSIFRAN